MDEAEPDVLAYELPVPAPLETPLHQSARTPQRRDQAPHRGRWHLPNEPAITRLVGAILLEQNEEYAVQRARYITLESIAPVGNDPIVDLPIAAG
jgi:hypothetical protein